MAYNVFKRPMFKRGGSTKGTGIMSHVEPRGVERVKAKTGFPFGNYSVGLPFEKSPYMSEPLNQETKSGLELLRQNNKKEGLDYFKDVGFGKTLAGTVNELKKAAAAGYDLAGVPLNVISKYFTGKSPNFSGARFFNVDGVNQDDTYFLGAKLNASKKGEDGTPGFGGATSLDEIAKKIETETAASEAVEKPDGGKEPKYEEADLRTEVQKEADEIMNMLKDEDLNKAEAALLVSKALKTPGSISDKIDVAVNDAMSIARRKSKEDKQAKLLAYQSVKEKEIAEAKRKELPPLGRTIQRLADLKATDPNLLSASEKNEMKLLEEKLDEETITEKANIKGKLDIYLSKRDSIPSLERKIKDLQGKKKLDDEEKTALENYITEYSILKQYEKDLGFSTSFAEGGRAEYAEGSQDPNAPTVESDETKGGSNIFPTKTVEKLSFAELRQKLPEEITNDIVQLIANSEEALQDFAYIKTQTDINDFNLKYGVNLVLPPQQG
jgi:hypothetical protein